MDHVPRKIAAGQRYLLISPGKPAALLPGDPAVPAGLGFQGVIAASNWITASPEVFGPLEKLSYTPGDFIDRHGYFGCQHKGQFAEWSIREGHTYRDRSALRFDPEEAGKPKQFVHPVMDRTMPASRR